MPGSCPNGRPPSLPLKHKEMSGISSAVQGGGKKGNFRSVGLDCQVSSTFIKSRHREAPGKLLHLLPEVGQTLACFWVIEQEGFEILELGGLALHLQANADSFIYKINNPPEVLLSELARSQCWGPKPQASRSNGAAVSRTGVLVGCDGDKLQHTFSSSPIQALRPQVYQHQVGVSATRHQ